jgi:hypothetical protein
MNKKAADFNERHWEKNEFVEELIYENIELHAENLKLDYENKKLRERVESIENFYKVFGINYIMKDGLDYSVVLIKKGKEGYRS